MAIGKRHGVAAASITGIHGVVPSARHGVAWPASGPTVAYVSGGTSADGLTAYDYVDKFTFSSESSANSTVLPAARQNTASGGNADYVYTVGGYVGGAVVGTIVRTPVSTDTPAASSASLGTASQVHATASDNSDKIFKYAGLNAGFSEITTCERVTVSTDSAAAVASGNLTSVTSWVSGNWANGTKAYIGCGGGEENYLWKMVWSSETTSLINAAHWGNGKSQRCFGSDNGTTVYAFGGTTAVTNAIEKTTTAADTRSAVAGTLATARARIGACSDATATYIFGGWFSTPVVYATAEKFTHASETSALLAAADLANTRSSYGCASNGGPA